MATGTSSRDGEPQATAAPPSEASVEDHDSAGGAEPAAGREEAVPQPSAAAGRRRTGPGHGRGGRDHLEDLEDDEDDFSTADEATRMARALATSSLRHMEAVADVVAAFAGSMVEADEDRRTRRGDRGRRRVRYRDRDSSEGRYEDDYRDVDDDDVEDRFYEDELRDEDDDLPRAAAARARGERTRRRRARRRRNDRWDEVADVADDLRRSAVDALRDWIDVPDRTVREFYDSYDADEPRSSRRRPARRAARDRRDPPA